MSADLIVGSQEYLVVEVTGDLMLDAQVVEIAVVDVDTRPTTNDWHTSAWTGDPGYTRNCRVFIGNSVGGISVDAGMYRVFVRVTDSPEIPIMDAGLLSVL